MDDVADRLQQMEANISLLNAENTASKVTILRLERRLSESERQVRELKAKEEPSSSEAVGEVKRIRALEKKVKMLEKQQRQQSQDTNEKLQRVDKLQLLLNGAILRRARASEKADSEVKGMSSKLDPASKAVEDLQMTAGQTASQTDELSSKFTVLQRDFADFKSSVPSRKEETIRQAQVFSGANPEESQDTPLRREFASHMERIEKRRVPLEVKDYRRMAALESIAGTSNGPAFKFLVHRNGNSVERTKRCRQEDEKKLRNDGISTPIRAMENYIEGCDKAKDFQSDTQFYPVYKHVPGNFVLYCVLAIDQFYLRVLDSETKKEQERWPVTEIRSCHPKQDWVEVTFTSGRPPLMFDAGKFINPQVIPCIRSLIGR